MEKSKTISILDTLLTMFPNAKCELEYNNLYELLIAVVLSAQTTDVRVNIVTKDLFKKYTDFYELANANFEDVENIIKSLGLSKNKAKNIILLSQNICDNFKGKVPSTLEELTTLPGVGRKTSNVILSEGFNIPALAVDTHVSRVANRLGLSNSNDVLIIEEDLKRQIDEQMWHKAHHLFIHFGRYFCKAKSPNCENCPFKGNICIKTTH